MLARARSWWMLPLAAMGLAAGCRGETGARVDFVSVEVESQPGHVSGYEVVVRVELETRSSMSHVAPHVKLLARCDGKSDDGQLFWMSLSDAQPGERKVDQTKLFSMGSLTEPARQCELTLALEPGPDGPAYFCYAGGKTAAGRCPDPR